MAATGSVLDERFYYGNDDLLQFQAAREDGLSWSYLSLNVWQHFGPYNRLAHLLVLRFSDLSPAWGLALALAHLTALLLACLWLMTELRLSTPRRVLALVAIGLSAPVAESAIWFDTSMHILPAIAITLAVCAAHVRGIRTGRTRWHVLTVVLFLLGQLVQERPIFALPLLVLVDVLLLWRADPWRMRLARLWQLRWPLAVLTLAAGGIAAAQRAFVVQDVYTTPDWGVTFRTMSTALTNYVVPSLVNQPRADPVGPGAEAVALAAVVFAGLLLAWLGRHNAGPLLFAGAVFLLYYGFLKFSPLLLEETIDHNARRLHNAVYVTVPAIIAFAHLRISRPWPWPGRRSATVATARPSPWSRARRPMQVAGCLALAGYLLVADIAYLDRRWGSTTDARAYLDQIRESADTWSDPGVTVVPLFGPPAMATSWAEGLSRHETLLPLIDKEYTTGDVGSDFVLLDDEGVPRTAELDTVRTSVEVDRGGCTPQRRFVDNADLFFRPVRGEPLFVKLQYRADRDLEVFLTAGWRTEWHLNAAATALPAGSHTRLIPIDATRARIVDLDVVTPDAGFCVQGASIVRPVLVEAEGTSCRRVDWYGRPLAEIDCP